LTLAANEAVQTSLGVSDDVALKLRSLRRRDYLKAEQKAFEDAGVTNLQDRMKIQTLISERPKYVEIVKQAQEGFLPQLKELLTAEQYQRLQQIQFQNRLNFYGPKTLLAPDVAPDLKLTDDQKQKLDVLNGEFKRIPFVLRDGRFFKEDSVKHGRQYRTKTIELLTAEQKEALNKREGDEFDLSALVTRKSPPPPRNGNVAGEPAIGQQKSTGAQRATLESDNIVNIAGIEAVQKDLGVSDEVARKLTLLRDEYRAAIQKEYQAAELNPRFNPNQLTFEQRRKHVEIGRSLNDRFFPKAEELLSADQQRRLQQIQFQSRLRSRGPGAFVMPEVASELKLTDDQTRKLNALRSEFMRAAFPTASSFKSKERKDVAERLMKHREEFAAKASELLTKAMEVLTAEQKETLNKLKGNEFDLSKLITARPPAKAN